MLMMYLELVDGSQELADFNQTGAPLMSTALNLSDLVCCLRVNNRRGSGGLTAGALRPATRLL
jgi:hypothetical protein